SGSLGTHDVTVTNPDGGTFACTACLTVNPKPAITSVLPTSRAHGSPGATVTISGTGFQPGAIVTFAGSGISYSNVVITPTSWTATVTVDSNAQPLGNRAITITNPDGGTDTKPTGFKIT
ncbi:MAG TPA: IPT/TIG domain-containing protein, partial [Acidimicrobiales bacterium]|nr:IPT/TIG domain-containing protein [Acidimicrobiales bacterium]